MAKPRSWWRKLFTDHPGLAGQLLDAYTSGKRPKVWCTACLQLAEDQYMRDGRSPTDVVWGDEVCLSVQGRGWIPYQPTTCWKHLSDCPSQTEEVRQKAREELGRHNARRRGKTQHTSTWRAHRRMVPDVSQALQSLADLGIRTSTMSSGSANHLSCVPDVSALSLSPPSPTPTVTQVEVSPLGAVSYNSLCLDACLALETPSSSAGGEGCTSGLHAGLSLPWHAAVAGSDYKRRAAPLSEVGMFWQGSARGPLPPGGPFPVRESSPLPQTPVDSYATAASAFDTVILLATTRCLHPDSSPSAVRDAIPENDIWMPARSFEYHPAYSASHDTGDQDQLAQLPHLSTSTTDNHVSVTSDSESVADFDAWLNSFLTAPILPLEHSGDHP